MTREATNELIVFFSTERDPSGQAIRLGGAYQRAHSGEARSRAQVHQAQAVVHFVGITFALNLF